jgi:hypothetical protein
MYNSNLNGFYSNSKLKHTSIQKHNAGRLNATINYIKPALIYQFKNYYFSYEFMLIIKMQILIN